MKKEFTVHFTVNFVLVAQVIFKILVVLGTVLFFVFCLQFLQLSIKEFLGDSLLTSLTQISDGHFLQQIGFGYLASILLFSGSSAAGLAVGMISSEIITLPAFINIVLGSRMAPLSIFVPLMITTLFWNYHRFISVYKFLLIVLLTTVLHILLSLPFMRFFKLEHEGSFSAFTVHSSESFIDTLKELALWLLQFIPAGIALPLAFGLLIFSLYLFNKSFNFSGFIPYDFDMNRLTIREEAQTILDKPLKNLLRYPSLLWKIFSFPVTYTHMLITRQSDMDLQSWLSKRTISFWLGVLFTVLSTSVTTSVLLIFPFYIRRSIKLDSVIFYILGCNVVTLIDTLALSALSQLHLASFAIAKIMLSLLLGLGVFIIFRVIFMYLIIEAAEELSGKLLIPIVLTLLFTWPLLLFL